MQLRPVEREGDVILPCPCCDANPVHRSWLRACAACGSLTCRVWLPDGEPVCRRCDPALPYDALGLPLAAAA